jgi:tetratricopeptide (TPR) repeat protein
MKYKNSPKKISEIGRELGVDYILEGSVGQDHGRVRIAAQLIRVENQAHVWAESYERDASDILLAQADVARAVRQQIRLTLSPQAEQQLAKVRRVNPEAYLDYLKGRLEDPKFTLPAMARAQAYYERALQRDPDFALAYLGLANCYMNYLITRRLPPQEAAEHTKEFIAKALQLDENLGEAYAVLAYVNWRYDWDVHAAEQNFRRALALSPNSVGVRGSTITYLAWRGRRTEAFAEWARARQLDPLWLEAGAGDGLIYYQLRDYGPMLEVMRKFVDSTPGTWLGRYLLGVAYEGSGQPRQAIFEYQKAVELSGNDNDPTAALAYAYARIGRRAEAKKILRELLELSKTGHVSPYMIATVYAGLGDKDRAFEFLEKAYSERSADLSYFLKADLRMDSLRPDPRFQDLVSRMGFPP